MQVAWLHRGGGRLQPSTSVRERLSGDEETRPVAARQYKYGVVVGGTGGGGGGWGSVEQLQVGDGNFALLVASLAHQPIRIHPRDAADGDHLRGQTDALAPPPPPETLGGRGLTSSASRDSSLLLAAS